MDIGKLNDEQLDQILRDTEYCERGVAIGDSAIGDQDLRRAVQAEIDKRIAKAMGF